MSEDIICRIVNVTKVFPGVIALNNVSFDIKKGEIHAIIGENGAGKSTLMNILSGVYYPDEGHIEFEGNVIKFRDPRHAQHTGIAMIHQELSLSRYMSVAENIYQGRMLTKSFGFIDRKKMISECRKYLTTLGVDNIDPRVLVKYLSVSQMQLIEIAKAVSLNAKLLIMDEPTSSLTTGEITLLLKIMKSLKNEGVSILFITHKLEEVLEIADRITVLRDGSYIDTLQKDDATLEKMVSLMVGRNFEKKAHREFIQDYSDREVILEVQNLSSSDRVKNVSFKLYKGEVLGLTGLVGSGRTELLQSIFGMEKMASGEVLINGKEVKINHPADAIKLGLGMIAEDRKEQGMLLKLSVQDNMTIVHLKKLSSALQFINKKRSKEISNKYVNLLSIKTPSLKQISKNLSGGNQQKTIIARWLMNQPKILFMDEPTHGIDVGAKAEIYKLIDELSKMGVSVILLSSELPEVLALCDRIMVMHHGQLKGILHHQEADQVKIMSFILENKKEIAS
ncbi:MAG: Galactose/methyl galactoside import ATP-binding protein MglA [Candidatus Atribacteria bacterium ADurb.Bin276]|jgi:ABC-type sugar transport system ATPase subunit|uniref:Galactose/methyl galactoside import ATP-binding protein MglA n=1 Tax=Candidatus Atribacter allofermentans TaxID=1852833 RepID=A0A1V5SKB6_9BACT|nr:MAG: Galactose/methyl galactoside import ATP-binding protein MglA [Candidatus Atribacteria bacterium ADurb.Bin276]